MKYGSEDVYETLGDSGKALMQTMGEVKSVNLADYLGRTGYGIAGYGDIRDLVPADEFEKNILAAKGRLEADDATACVDVPNAGFGSELDALRRAIKADYLKHPGDYRANTPMGPADPYFYRRNTTFQSYWKNTGRWHK